MSATRLVAGLRQIAQRTAALMVPLADGYRPGDDELDMLHDELEA